MSNLMNTTEGRNALIEAQKYLLRRRLSRFFKRNLVVNFNEYLAGGQFNIQGLLGQLNAINDPEIIELYRLLGIVGGLDVTVADMDIHVNAITGSDETGDGSATNPYATLWFVNSLPKKLKHRIIIYLQTDIVCNDTLCFDQTIAHTNGQIFIVGRKPYLVTKTVSINSVINHQARYIINGTNTTSDYNAFVHFRTGIHQGKCFPLLDNDGAGNYQIPYHISGPPAPGDIFDVVVPDTRLTLAGLIVDMQGPQKPLTGGYSQLPRFCLQNLYIKNTMPVGNFPTYYLTGNTGMNFVSIEVSAPNPQWCVEGSLNGSPQYDYSGTNFLNSAISSEQAGVYFSRDSLSVVPSMLTFVGPISLNAVTIRSNVAFKGVLPLPGAGTNDYLMRRVSFVGSQTNVEFRSCKGRCLLINFPDNNPSLVIIENSNLAFSAITTSSKMTQHSFEIWDSNVIIQAWDDISDNEALPVDKRGGLLLHYFAKICLLGGLPQNPNADACKFVGLAVAMNFPWPAVDSRNLVTELGHAITIRPTTP